MENFLVLGLFFDIFLANSSFCRLILKEKPAGSAFSLQIMLLSRLGMKEQDKMARALDRHCYFVRRWITDPPFQNYPYLCSQTEKGSYA